MKTEMVSLGGMHIIIPMASEDAYHYFALMDEDGQIIMENPFCGYEKAAACAEREFPDCDYTVKDMTKEWYASLAARYAEYPKIRIIVTQ